MLRIILTVTLLFLAGSESLAARHHFGAVVLMGKVTLVFDDTKLLFHAGMTSGDFFDRLERRMMDRERFYLNSKPISDYPELVKVKLFANEWASAGLPEWASPEIRYPGTAKAVMDSIVFKAEWKTGLTLRPVLRTTVRRLQKDEMMPYPSLWGYELAVSSKGIPLTDHLIVSVYGPDSSLIARFSGAP